MSEVIPWVDAVSTTLRLEEAPDQCWRFSKVVGEIYAVANAQVDLDRAMRAIATYVSADRAELIADNVTTMRRSTTSEEVVIRRGSRGQTLEADVAGGEISLRLRAERHQQWPRFEHEEIRGMEMILPHLRRAIELRQQAAAVKATPGFELSILSRLGVAVAIVDDSLSLDSANDAARAIFEQADGIVVDKGQLFASTAHATVRLRNAVNAVLTGARALSTVVIVRSVADMPLHLTMTSSGRAGRAVLILSDARQPSTNTMPILADSYGLSPAEGRLVQLLIAGRSAIEAAAILGVSPNTARTQLKSILRKTSTRRQSELVSVLLRGALRFT